LIIGICGLIGSGKGTVADILEEHHCFDKVSFADTLKNAAATIFRWDRAMLEGDTKDSREKREQVDEWWAERLGIPDFSPRYLLQYMGTEVMRNNLHPDIWVLSLERKIIECGPGDYVVPDVRFPNEIRMIKRNGGKVWHVQRGELPDWFGQNPSHIHASETSWNNEIFDATIYNNGTIDDLKLTVDNLLKAW
jgi:hypothetical protein